MDMISESKNLVSETKELLLSLQLIDRDASRFPYTFHHDFERGRGMEAGKGLTSRSEEAQKHAAFREANGDDVADRALVFGAVSQIVREKPVAFVAALISNENLRYLVADLRIGEKEGV